MSRARMVSADVWDYLIFLAPFVIVALWWAVS